MVDYLVKVVEASWGVLGEMSVYLLFGFFVAGVLSVFLSADWVKRHLGGWGVVPVFKASLFGVPLPLCSCGVIPVSASIRRSGASKASTTSFLLSTPQTGVDSIMITYGMLGPVFGIFRPIAALVTGVFGGWLVRLFGGEKEDEAAGTNDAIDNPKQSCSDRCGEGKTASGNKIKRVFVYGFLTLPRDIGFSLPVGILVAGIITALIPKNSLQGYIGEGWTSIVLLMIVGIPIYVCATASVPIAASFIHLGASPGAALAFLVAGPVTNAATLAMIWKMLGRRVAIIYLVTVGISALVGGLLLNQLIGWAEFTIPHMGGGEHEHGAAGGWWYDICAVVMLGVMSWAIISKFVPVGKTVSTVAGGSEAGEDTVRFIVSGMTCSHCVAHVKEAVAGCEGVRSVEVNLGGGEVIVLGESFDVENISAAVIKLGYKIKNIIN
ncbi:MAG: SO_0444 family Cu/Zn efflux transporter [Planctomycetes bacterium]|nr:SO_0444 family Cu/Zn efflux transporter [Planctomycetota bacterium]